jgi:hypothetical protein
MYEEQNSAVKPEVRSEVCNLSSVVTETFGVLSLFGVVQCYSYSKTKIVIVNCNSAWSIPTKSSVKSGIHPYCRVSTLNTLQYEKGKETT